ncbi:WAS/WASL-interacting protein family member 2 isoform X2 [Dendroctonus ponderosae]|uniref:WAS/WASL-interacting protein family member 2 isoform X2 n=1 Tax=Dendroctonus ponderosae TaxID=77166 RepID=UPI0020360A5E|nr:WAS/WASL-interacting protein family member 2 isoform X2 [Dendroctonus ponderosae]
MPGPPPPPPPGPPPFLGGGSAPDGRGALLQSIRQGAKLKKTVTVDKSAPAIPSNNSSAPRNGLSSSPMPNGIPLGGLFAGGMPKLKATGLRGPSPAGLGSPSPARAANSVQDQLKRQLHNPSDTKTRGPPPPAPVRHISADEGRPAKPLAVRLNGAQPNQSSLHATAAKLHRKSKSNANLCALDAPDTGNALSKPAISHGKPHLAPKPPLLNGKPAPPSKLSLKISRAQSMRAPRSPSPQSPPALDVGSKFGTVRNMSSLLGQSLNSLSASPRPRPALAGRPSVPPPSVPPPPTPKAAPVKPPSHAPPPPPAHAPPPPPHKTLSQPSRPPPAVPGNNANPPPPPPRHSSMRDVQHQQTARRLAADLEEKFRSAFAAPERFPRPPPYRNVVKSYSNKQESSC